MNKYIIILFIGLISTSADAYAGLNLFRKKEKATTTQSADSTKKRDKTTKYERTFIKDKNCVAAKGDFISLYKSKGKLYFELPLKYLGREMLIASTISEASDTDLGTIGYKPKDPMHVKFTLVDSLICLNSVNLKPNFNKSNTELSNAIGLSSMDPILSTHPVFCYNKDSSAVVFEMTSLFTGNNDALSPMTKGGSGVNVTGTFNSKGSILTDIKAFEDNVTIKSLLSYTVTADLMKLVLLKRDQPMTYKVTRTILLLPEEKMRPRLADSRIGIFNSNKLNFSDEDDYIKTYSVIHRWNLQPKDTAAFLRGELTDPIKPIIFYIDSAFPATWKEGAKKGITRWNKAFEEIGFSNVVQVLDYPENDPDFDPDNLKYSCIRYVPARVSNAMGPSWVDPSTGEIINASVIIFQDVTKLLNQWRFVQTAQIDESIRNKKMSDSLVEESIAYILAHEVGHCLGFMHNMAASSAFPVDSLRSATFTQKYGTTPSIMDYARFNYVAQPTDKGVRLTPPDLGEYDYYLVDYAYRPLPDKNNEFDETEVLEALIDSKAGNPAYRYGKQQVIQRYDPSSIEEDLGDDPIKAANYGVKNLKYILNNLNNWIPNKMDPDASYREMTYENLAKQYNRYIQQVMLNIGGIYLTEVKAGTPGDRAKAVDKKRQKEALKWVVNQLQNCDWLVRPDITDYFSLRIKLEPILQYYTALEVFETINNVMLSYHLDPKNGYSPNEYFDDMYSMIWKKTINGTPLDQGDMIIQRLFVEKGVNVINKKTQLLKVNTLSGNAIVDHSAASVYSPSVNQILAFNIDESGIIDQYQDILRDLDAQHGKGYVARNLSTDAIGYGYGWQYRVNLRSIDQSRTLFHSQLVKIEKLLKANIAQSHGQTRSHYEALLFTIQEALSANNQ